MNMELSFEMTDEELEKLRKILTDGGVRHYILEISDNEKIDVVEYKEYEKIEKENQELKKQLEEERKKVSEYSYKLSNFRCEETYETQQKEFIEYLENMLDNENDIFSVVRVKDVLSKYKEIIGNNEQD